MWGAHGEELARNWWCLLAELKLQFQFGGSNRRRRAPLGGPAESKLADTKLVFVTPTVRRRRRRQRSGFGAPESTALIGRARASRAEGARIGEEEGRRRLEKLDYKF